MTILTLGACGRGFQDPAREPDEGSQPVASGSPLRILFFGDSITAGGVKAGGYVALIESAVRYLYPDREIEVIGSGVVGDRVPHLLDRFGRDVASKDPTHVVVYIGVNDVGRPAAGNGITGLRNFRRDMSDLLRRIAAAGAKPIVCTPAVIGEDPASPTRENLLLDRYAAISREVAADFGARVCDLRAAFASYLELYNREGEYEGILTRDGVHLNEEGHRFVARQILATLDDEIAGRAVSASGGAQG